MLEPAEHARRIVNLELALRAANLGQQWDWCREMLERRDPATAIVAARLRQEKRERQEWQWAILTRLRFGRPYGVLR